MLGAELQALCSSLNSYNHGSDYSQGFNEETESPRDEGNVPKAPPCNLQWQIKFEAGTPKLLNLLLSTLRSCIRFLCPSVEGQLGYRDV